METKTSMKRLAEFSRGDFLGFVVRGGEGDQRLRARVRYGGDMHLVRVLISCDEEPWCPGLYLGDGQLIYVHHQL